MSLISMKPGYSCFILLLRANYKGQKVLSVSYFGPWSSEMGNIWFKANQNWNVCGAK